MSFWLASSSSCSWHGAMALNGRPTALSVSSEHIPIGTCLQHSTTWMQPSRPGYQDLNLAHVWQSSLGRLKAGFNPELSTHHLNTLHEGQANSLVPTQRHHTGRGGGRGLQQGQDSLHAHTTGLHRVKGHPCWHGNCGGVYTGVFILVSFKVIKFIFTMILRINYIFQRWRSCYKCQHTAPLTYGR